jgi:predicted alpha/beta-hydrolase family hydrolase
MSKAKGMRFAVPDSGEVSALFVRPPGAKWLLVLGHGAGAGMRHPFLETITRELATVDVATFRYQFPYMEKQRPMPDPSALLTTTVRAAVRSAAEAAPHLPLLAGGKSMGGRMTSLAAAQQPLEGVRGLVFLGFPVHPPNRPSTKRGDHLAKIDLPMLFLQGTRDPFAALGLLRPICGNLGSRATLHVVDTADHSFQGLKRAGKSAQEIMRDLAQTVRAWADASLE